MNIKKLVGSSKQSGHCLLSIEGDLNIYNAAEAKEKLSEFMDDFNEYEINMSAVNEIDSSGIQLLLQLNNKAAEGKRNVQLSDCNQQVSDLFELYRLQDMLAEPAIAESNGA